MPIDVWSIYALVTWGSRVVLISWLDGHKYIVTVVCRLLLYFSKTLFDKCDKANDVKDIRSFFVSGGLTLWVLQSCK